MSMLEPVTLGVIATDTELIPGIFREQLPPGWRLVTATGPDDPSLDGLLRESDYVVSVGQPFGRNDLEKAPRVRMVQKMGAGFDNIDIGALAERGIPFATCPIDSAADALAEHAVALAMASLKSIPYLSDAVCKDHRWPKWESRNRIRQVRAQTVGILGFGRTGRRTARLFAAFGCPVIVYARTPPPDAQRLTRQAAAQGGIRFTDDMNSVFEQASVVSVHIALSDETRGLIGRHQLALLGPQGLLVNTARGELVDEAALTEALKSGALGAAATDVLCEEPPPASLELLRMPNLIVTPHCAGGGIDMVEEKARFVLDNILNCHEGRPIQATVTPSGTAA